VKRLFLILVIILSLGALILGSCAKATPTPTATTPTTTTPPTTTAPLPPIKIGHIVNLTGPEATVGGMQKTSLEATFSENSSIGSSILGRQVQIIIGDAGGEPATAVDVARKMVEQDKVVAIFGPTEIGQKMAVADYCQQVGIPLILYNPEPVSIFASNPWVIAAGGTNEQYTSCMGDYLYTHLGYKTITTMTEDNDAGRGFMNPLTDVFTAEGGTVVQQQWFAEDTADYAPYLTAVKSADAIVAWTSGDSAIKLLSQYHQLGIDQKMPIEGAFHGGFLDPFVPLGMDPADAAAIVGAMCPMEWAPDSQDPTNQDFLKVLTPLVSFPPGDDAASGPYQAALLFVAAVKSTNGDTTPAKLLAALKSVSIVGPEGPMSLNGQGAATMNIYILKVDKVPNVNAYHYTTVYIYKNVPPAGYSGQ
jgi:branched-chain amino acid transport system substrate-binding protein